jgi:serine/threonine protein kinase
VVSLLWSLCCELALTLSCLCQMSVNILGSPGYAAPELQHPAHTPKVDVFSAGIIFWEIDEQQEPWQGLFWSMRHVQNPS